MYNILSSKLSLFFLLLIIPGLVSGPFIPDLSISILGLLFLANLYFTKNFKYIDNKFSYLFLAYYLLLLISSIFSDDILFSFESSFFYFRFGVFALALSFLISDNTKYTKYFLNITLLTFLLVSIDGIYELLNGKNFFNKSGGDGRLAGLFDDELIIGSFLSRNLPLLFFLFLNVNQNLNRNQLIYFIPIIMLSCITIVFSGERTAFMILLIIFSIYFIFLFKFYFFKFYKIILIFFSVSIILFAMPFITFDSTQKRMTQDLSSHFSLNVDDSVYFSLFNTSYLMFLDKPLIGHGTKMFRKKCEDFKKNNYGCNTHPHNTYAQILSETGIVGFFFIFSLFLYICFKILKIFFKKKISYIDWQKLSLLICFFITTSPIILSGNFFNNWLCVIYFLPIGFYLNLSKK
jgi:O-antigen ligase